MRLLTSALLIAAVWAAWPAPAAALEEGRFIRNVHMDYLGRQPTRDELRYWRDRMDEGMTRKEVRIQLLGSEAYFVRHERDRSRFIRSLYKHLLDRRPQRFEVNHWLDRWLELPHRPRVDLVREFEGSAAIERRERRERRDR